jgi:outer membrane protein assembly factor BamD
VVFRVAESFYKQVPDTHDRDLVSAHEAIKYYAELNSKYPANKFEKASLKKINICRKKIKAKEKYIADFYFKTKVFSAARYRYLKIMREFGDPGLLDHSMKRIILSSYKLGELKECKDYSQKFGAHLKKKSKSDIKSVINKCLKHKS